MEAYRAHARPTWARFPTKTGQQTLPGNLYPRLGGQSFTSPFNSNAVHAPKTVIAKPATAPVTASTVIPEIGINDGIDTVIDALSLVTDGPEATLLQQSQAENAAFSWTAQWYAVAVESLLDPSRPNAVKLLGKDLVLWREPAGRQWRCFEDRCPHRAAPLSEGKVWGEGEGGTLMCSYHGWRFTGEGSCVSIPQSASAAAEQKAVASPRACAVSYPLRVAQGIVFVWGESGPAAHIESAAAPLPVDPLLEEAMNKGEELQWIIPKFYRDLPYDFQTLVENVADPAHAPFAHHKVQGNRANVKYGDYEMTAISDGKNITMQYDTLFGPGKLSFCPPSRVSYVTTQPDGSFSSFIIFCTPTGPGTSRIVTFLGSNRKKIRFIFKALLKLPLWLSHILFRHNVLDGDNVFLHQQEHKLVEEDKAAAPGTTAAWRKRYFMPTRADTLVAAFRNWMDTCGRGGPFGPLHEAPNYPPLITDRRVLLDRYASHTQHCVECKRALAWVERLRFLCGCVAAIGFGAAVSQAVVAGSLLVQSVARFGLVGFIFSLFWRWLSVLREKFYYTGYDHAVL